MRNHRQSPICPNSRNSVTAVKVEATKEHDLDGRYIIARLGRRAWLASSSVALACRPLPVLVDSPHRTIQRDTLRSANRPNKCADSIEARNAASSQTQRIVMCANLGLAIISAFVGVYLWVRPEQYAWLSLGFLGLGGWQLYSAFRHRAPRSPIILRLGGFSWTREDFCRGWLVTGETGSGKTLGGINTMLWEITTNCPNWGGVCVDDKGLYAETLATMLDEVGRRDDLIILTVRPDGAPLDWKPPHTFNFLADPYLPYSGKAKIICDVAAAQGQRSDQTFFRTQAQVQMEFAFSVLAARGVDVTLETAYDLLMSDEQMTQMLADIAKRGSPDAERLKDHYDRNFASQPPEQLGGVRTTIANYLAYFKQPDIANVFCPLGTPSVAMGDVDRGKIICVSIPQRFPVERRYIQTLLKLSFYSHALRRFDRSATQRAQDNLLIFWAGEAQKIVTASEDGLSDYNVVDVIREARATFVGDTQAFTSLVPPMGDEKKAKVFIANMANRITFKAADEDSAKIAADTIGKRTIRKRTYGYSAGRRTTSWTPDEKYFIEPHEFRRLRKFQAVVQHCEKGFRRVTLPPREASGKVASWYR